MSSQRAKQKNHEEKRLSQVSKLFTPAHKSSSQKNLLLTWFESVHHAGSSSGWCRGMTCLRWPPRHHGNRANNKLCDVLQDFRNRCQVVRRIRDCLCHATSRTESNMQILFHYYHPPPFKQLHYKISSAQE